MVEPKLSFEKVPPDELFGPLNEIEKKYSPEILYIQGDRDLMKDRPRVSIIGTRNPTATGIANAKKITEFLVNRDVVIVSGLAAGIDSVAHSTAIKSGGRTIAVLGTPLNEYYPAQNRQLQDEIANKHLVISQFPFSSPIQRHNFPMRNRTMALLSHASVIVEAGKTSGTEHQGWEALRLGRSLFIMDTLINDQTLEWPQKLVEYGAEVLSLERLKMLFEPLPEPQQVIQNAFAF